MKHGDPNGKLFLVNALSHNTNAERRLQKCQGNFEDGLSEGKMCTMKRGDPTCKGFLIQFSPIKNV